MATFRANPVAAPIDVPLHAFLPFPHVDHLHPDWGIALAAAANANGPAISNTNPGTSLASRSAEHSEAGQPKSLFIISLMPQFPTGQTLFIDADDTLWENNIYFERAIAAYITYLDHQSHTPEQVRLALNQAERETILSHGYGLTSFAQSLITCFERLTQSPIAGHHQAQIRSFAQSIADQEIELLPGVAELLPHLATRHRLILMTKGSHAEQADKLDRSGLANYFTGVEIVHEKDPAAYSEVATRHNCNPATTWMIGNSPKSDINPSLAAGLNAVFIFHKDTWVLEHAEINPAPPGQHLIEVDSFRKLAEIF